ncbi:polysaccharide deacetylase family protein [Cellulomonas sp. 179-A 9B4 NHS]|uniref:polysaccharide deacetylase family protein n=1 Tax=Cellulomonas sp. 179-A 9B4 NHS TaxID=3142379 RepID=UPI0039A2EAF5
MTDTFARPRTRWRRSGPLRAVLGTAAAAAVLAGGLAAAPAATAITGSTCSAGYVGLTFDDGPTAGTTNQIISTLRQYGATATVFPTGQNAQNNASLMQAYKNAGLQIGNHSWDHPHLVQQSQSQVQSQLSRTQQAIQQTAGVTPTVFRPPYGESNGTVSSVASSLGLRVVTWDVDSNDWNNASAASIRQAATRLTNGQTILMHDWPSATVQALPGILQDLRSRNLCTGHISSSTGRVVAPAGGGTTTPPPTTPPPTNGGGGSCTATATKTQEWGDRFNVTYNVSAPGNWSVTVYPNSGQSIQSAWGATRNGTTFTGSGSSSFGVTYYKGSQNLSWTPTGVCSPR